MIISATATTNGSTSPLSPATIAVDKSIPREDNVTSEGCSSRYQLDSESTEPNGSSVASLTPRGPKKVSISEQPHQYPKVDKQTMSPSYDCAVVVDMPAATSASINSRTGSPCLEPLTATSPSLALSCSSSSSLIPSPADKFVDETLDTLHLDDGCMSSTPGNRTCIVTSAAVSSKISEFEPQGSGSADPIDNTQPKPLSLSKRPLAPALKRRSGPDSCLRKSLVSSGATKARPSTGRRVAGLWNPVVQSSPVSSSSSPVSLRNSFEGLQDDTLERILSFLSMGDWLKCNMVDRRWNYMTKRDSLWKQVDATEFVRDAHEHFTNKVDFDTATRLTSEALDKVVQRYTSVVSSLTIRSIGNSISAEWFLPTASSLHELTLCGFDDLNDTHIHVMLLAGGNHGLARRSTGGIPLRKLVLEDCPLLTDASLRSIANICPNLEELSLKGSGRKSPKQLSDMTPIADLLTVSPKLAIPDMFGESKINENSKFQLSKRAAASSGPPPGGLSLQSLFGGPPPAKVAAAPSPANLCANPAPASSGLSLQSLFGGPPPAKVAATPAAASAASRATPTPGASPLQSLFGGPPTTKTAVVQPSVAPSLKPRLSGGQLPQTTPPQLATLFAPPPAGKPQATSPVGQLQQGPPQEVQPSNALASLFAPPGTSPRRPKAPAQVIPTMRTSGKLVRLDLRETPISAQAFLACLLKAAATTNALSSQYTIHFESICLNGSTWTDAYLHKLGSLLAFEDLQELDLGVSYSAAAKTRASTKLTNAGLASFVAAASSCCSSAKSSTSPSTSTPCLSKLKRINLTGHNQITSEDVAANLMPAAPLLDTVTI